VFCKETGWDCDEEKMAIPSPCPETCYLLAKAYHFGRSGLAQDKEYALELYRTAASKGHRQAERAYDNLKENLINEPLNKSNIQKPPTKLFSKVKKNPSRKVPMKLLKEYFFSSNVKYTMFPNHGNRDIIDNVPLSSSGFDSNYINNKYGPFEDSEQVNESVAIRNVVTNG